MMKFDTEFKRSFEEKLEFSSTLIKNNLKNSSIVLWSGGKDSTVLLHLILQMKKNIHVLFEDTGGTFPEVLSYVKKISEKWKIENFHYLKASHDPWNLPDSPFQNYAKCTYWLKIYPSLEILKRYNIKVQFLGDRGEEHISRRKKFEAGAVEKVYIPTIDTTINNVYPLAYWSLKDVFKYIETYKIPVSDVQKKLGYTVCTFCPYHNFEKLQKFYPHVYEDLCRKVGATSREEVQKRLKYIFI